MAMAAPSALLVGSCIARAAFAVVAVAAAWSLSCTELPAQTSRQVDVPRVRREPFERQYLLSGELVAERAIDLVAPDVGIRPLEVRQVVVNGTQVAAGDVLMAFDNSELAAGLEEQRIALLTARTGLVTTESQTGSRLAEAQFDLERRQADLQKARIDAAIPAELKSKEEYQRLQTELRKAESRLVDAEKALAAAKAIGGAQEQLQRLTLGRSETDLARLEQSISRLQIVAPTAGVALVANNQREGRRWRVGDPAYPGARMVTLPDLSTMIVRARLYDVDDGVIEAGSPAVVILDPYPDTVIGARIRHIDPMALQWEERSSSRIFWVTVELTELDLERMRPGMSVKVIVARPGTAEGESGQGAAAASGAPPDPLVVPRSSLKLDEAERPRLLLADGSWRDVELGPCDPLRCVVESGVEDGMRLGWVGAPVSAP
ncbi:MAG TPA: efflux RND transporter periplasmic adaptor subunit [Thermoanaerobaculia bacterium]|nr:efflux RND transporter periplasmic adaptor subunit [Thermoanaerobaculia bacterium]